MNYLHGIRKTRIKQPHLLSWLLLLFPETLSVAVAFQPLSHIQLFVTPWTAARQASLSFTVSWSLLKFMSIESVMLSNYLVLCCPLLLLSSIFSIIRIFSRSIVYIGQIIILLKISKLQWLMEVRWWGTTLITFYPNTTLYVNYVIIKLEKVIVNKSKYQKINTYFKKISIIPQL